MKEQEMAGSEIISDRSVSVPTAHAGNETVRPGLEYRVILR
jgi:hypothetical protein